MIGDDDITTGEWIAQRYLRYWYWLGVLVVIVALMGLWRWILPYGHFLIMSLISILVVCPPAYSIYRRIWPRGPDELP
ncbi:MAG TPA: hypothetical protein EYP43_01995 [Thermoplasmata archaeon]|nr:hypothetical protein [Thermoplasmata archaeon]